MDQGNAMGSPASEKVTPALHTPTPWFVSGVRYRMNGGEWHNINRYDEAKKQDENIACVGYDPRTGLGHADAHFIVKAVNNHEALVNALRNARNYIDAVVVNTPDKKKRRNYSECLRIIEAALKPVGGNEFSAAGVTAPDGDATSVAR